MTSIPLLEARLKRDTGPKTADTDSLGIGQIHGAAGVPDEQTDALAGGEHVIALE